MKTGEVAKLLGVDNGTIRNWVINPLLENFFSPSAKNKHGGTHRVFLENDLLILNTIGTLRSNGVTDWGEIVKHLESGEREQEFPQNATMSGDTRTIPLPLAEQTARSAATLAERDAALEIVKELRQRIKELEQGKEQVRKEKDELREKLTEENLELREKFSQQILELTLKLGRLEGRLEQIEKSENKNQS